MSRRFRIPAVCLALIGQFVGVFGLPIVTGHESAPNTPVTACGCSVAERDAGLCCCHRPALPPCCAKKAASQHPKSCCESAVGGHGDDSSHEPVVGWVNSVLRQKCLGDEPTVTGVPVTPGIVPDLPATFLADVGPVDRLAVADLSGPSVPIPPAVPPPR